MRQWRSMFARVLPMVMLATLFALFNAAPVHADPVPATSWPVQSLTDFPGATTLMTDANNGVTVGCPQTGYAALFRSYSATGTVLQDRQVPSGYGGSFCTSNGTVASDGTVFVSLANANGTAQYIQAWKNNTKVWEYQLPCGPYGSAWTMTVGADGNLYILVWQGGGSCSSSQLIGLTPTAQQGTSPAVPQVVMNQPIYGGSVLPQGMAAYDGGLVIYMASSVQYVTYAGVFGDPVSVNAVRTQVGVTDHWFEAAPDGRVFVANRASSSQSSGCDNPNSIAYSISAIEPGEGVGLTSDPLPACATVRELHPRPGGGFIVRYTYSPSGGDAVERVAAYSSTGTESWVKEFNAIESPSNIVTGIDLAGKVVIRRNLAEWKSVGGSSYRFPEIDFTVLAPNGSELSSFALRGKSETTSGPSYMWGSSGEIPMAQDAVYVAAYDCTTLSSCNMATSKLYAFRVTGLEMDYPRGAIFGQTPRTAVDELNYVALGDSFSSGEGVPPFESGTDVPATESEYNQCHRSTVAYSRLLGDDPSLRVKRVASIACSGAETKHIVNTHQYTQPPQASMLNAGVDVVTITVGGNDIGFGKLAEQCIKDFASGCESSVEYGDAVDALANELPDALDAAYGAIASHVSGSTRVIVVGYPMMIPDPAINTLPNCPYLDHDEKVAARSVISSLNTAIQDAVGRAGSQFEYVDPNQPGSPFTEHELCMADGYFNGVDLANNEFSLHPTAEGQRAYEEVIRDYLLS